MTDPRALLFVLIVPLVGCGVRGVDPETLPTELRSAYALFETRCSKCHTIARPLNAPVRDITHWELYVTRMRRQPGSGIDEADAREILRFLAYYVEMRRDEHARHPEESAAPSELDREVEPEVDDRGERESEASLEDEGGQSDVVVP